MANISAACRESVEDQAFDWLKAEIIQRGGDERALDRAEWAAVNELRRGKHFSEAVDTGLAVAQEG